MSKSLLIAATLAASLTLASCGSSAPDETASPAAAVSAPAPTPPPAAQPAPAATPAAAATTAGYQIAPFPVTGVKLCDQYASEARRCLNQFGTSDDQRRSYEQTILDTLEKIEPPEAGEHINEWTISDCRRGIEILAKRFPQCGVQQE